MITELLPRLHAPTNGRVIALHVCHADLCVFVCLFFDTKMSTLRNVGQHMSEGDFRRAQKVNFLS